MNDMNVEGGTILLELEQSFMLHFYRFSIYLPISIFRKTQVWYQRKKKSKLGKVIKRPKMREIYDLQSTQFRLLLKWLCHKNRLTSFSSPVNASLWICHHIEIPPQFHHLPSHYQPHSLLTSPRCHLSLQFSNFQQFAKVSETGNCVLKRRGDRV